MLKILQVRFQPYINWEYPDVLTGFRKARGTRNQIANICWIAEKAREFQKNIYFCFIDYAKAFDCVITPNWKILKEMEIPGHLTCLLRNLYGDQDTTVRTRHGTMDWFKIRKDVKEVYRHPAYLIYMQSTSCEMPGWMNPKLESTLPGEISRGSDTQMILLQWQQVRGLLMEAKEESEKAGLKRNIQKMKIMASGPISSWQIDGETKSDRV